MRKIALIGSGDDRVVQPFTQYFTEIGWDVVIRQTVEGITNHFKYHQPTVGIIDNNPQEELLALRLVKHIRDNRDTPLILMTPQYQEDLAALAEGHGLTSVVYLRKPVDRFEIEKALVGFRLIEQPRQGERKRTGLLDYFKRWV